MYYNYFVWAEFEKSITKGLKGPQVGKKMAENDKKDKKCKKNKVEKDLKEKWNYLAVII